MDKVDALTERQELFLSGCHLDKEGTEEEKTNEVHQVEKSLNKYKGKNTKYMKHVAVNMANLPSQEVPAAPG